MARVIFMGTPEFAIPSLHALIEMEGIEMAGVVTQPDQPAGRGRALRPSAIKRYALAMGLPIFQPETLRNADAVAHLRAWQPDVLIVAAFGQILKPDVLSLAPWGSLNVHASLLPRWRGAAPIQHAIRAGDTETGVTIMRLDAGMDTGPILLQRSVPIAPDETGASLHDKLAALGAKLLREALPPYLAGELQPYPQPDEGVTYAPTLKKADGQIDWRQPSLEIDRQVRAYTPWPGTFTFWDGQMLKVLRGTVLPQQGTPGRPGALTVVGVDLAAQTGKGLYRLDVVQLAGKKAMTGQAFLAGHRQAIGSILGAAG